MMFRQSEMKFDMVIISELSEQLNNSGKVSVMDAWFLLLVESLNAKKGGFTARMFRLLIFCTHILG